MNDDPKAAAERLNGLSAHMILTHAMAIGQGKESAFKIAITIGSATIATFDAPEFIRDIVAVTSVVLVPHDEEVGDERSR